MKLSNRVTAFVPLAASLASGQSDQTLEPFALSPLPLGTIKPNGWLRDQMGQMAAGLAGHEYEFYRFVMESGWLGGDQDYSSLKEGFPYWFNGLVPLAYGLDDDTLKTQVRSAADYVLKNQAGDGWIGPETGNARNVWGRIPVIMGLVNMADADPDYTDKVVDSLYSFSGLLNKMLNNDFEGYHYHDGDVVSEFDTSWGRVRYQDLVSSFQWLFEKHPREQSDADTLFDNMKLLHQGAMDWSWWFSEANFIKQDLNMMDPSIEDDSELFPFVHNVNMAQGLKATSVVWRFNHSSSLVDNAREGVDLTFQYHTAPSGAILGDERLAGLSPYYGSELCGVVEEMYSLTTMRNILGDGSFADKAELVAFNALPAMLTPDWWAHQYVAQPNQAYSRLLTDPGTDTEDTPFWNVNAVGQTFGLEPDFPCCVVNHPQGFPKFLQAVYTLVSDGDSSSGQGIAHSLLAPASARVSLEDEDDSSSTVVDIDCQTNYPFDNTFDYTIKTDKSFTFHVRLPSWADASSSTITTTSTPGNGKNIPINPDSLTNLTPIPITPGTTTITYKLSPSSPPSSSSSSPLIQIQPRANSTISILSGPLLYSLSITPDSSKTPPKTYDTREPLGGNNIPSESHDWTFQNASAWAVAIDPSTLTYHHGTQSSQKQLADPIFAPGAPPNHIEFLGCELQEWPIYHGVPDSPPPLESNRTCREGTEGTRYKMIPYGSAKIRMTELPAISLGGKGAKKKEAEAKAE